MRPPSRPAPERERDEPDRIASVNLGGTIAVLQLARRFDVRRVVVLSSVAVYGGVGPEQGRIAAGRTPPKPDLALRHHQARCRASGAPSGRPLWHRCSRGAPRAGVWTLRICDRPARYALAPFGRSSKPARAGHEARLPRACAADWIYAPRRGRGNRRRARGGSSRRARLRSRRRPGDGRRDVVRGCSRRISRGFDGGSSSSGRTPTSPIGFPHDRAPLDNAAIAAATGLRAALRLARDAAADYLEWRRNRGMKRLAGKVAIVTGGASGIGRAIARAICARRRDRRDRRRDRGPSAKAGHRRTNCCGPTAFRSSSSRPTCRRRRRPRRSCATPPSGTAASTSSSTTPPSASASRSSRPRARSGNRVLAVNLTGVFLMCRAAVRQMLRQEPRNETRGRIVNISSQHGMIAAPEDIAYGTSKSGVVYITRQIAADYAKDQIVCNAVAPGKILTGKSGRAVEPRWIDYSQARTPMARLGTPEDVARAALFLASDEATYLTGVNLMVDGGWMAA